MSIRECISFETSIRSWFEMVLCNIVELLETLSLNAKLQIIAPRKMDIICMHLLMTPEGQEDFFCSSNHLYPVRLVYTVTL